MGWSHYTEGRVLALHTDDLGLIHGIPSSTPAKHHQECSQMAESEVSLSTAGCDIPPTPPPKKGKRNKIGMIAQ